MAGAPMRLNERSQGNPRSLRETHEYESSALLNNGLVLIA